MPIEPDLDRPSTAETRAIAGLRNRAKTYDDEYLNDVANSFERCYRLMIQARAALIAMDDKLEVLSSLSDIIENGLNTRKVEGR